MPHRSRMDRFSGDAMDGAETNAAHSTERQEFLHAVDAATAQDDSTDANRASNTSTCPVFSVECHGVLAADMLHTSGKEI